MYPLKLTHRIVRRGILSIIDPKNRKTKLIIPQVYISSRDAKACFETAEKLTKQGPGECVALPGDLSKFDECVKLAKEIEKREKGQSLSSLFSPSLYPLFTLSSLLCQPCLVLNAVHLTSSFCAPFHPPLHLLVSSPFHLVSCLVSCLVPYCAFSFSLLALFPSLSYDDSHPHTHLILLYISDISSQ